MPRRNKMNRKRSKKVFTRASGHHPKNKIRPMRGGIRL